MKTKVGLLIGICIIIALIACEKELDIQKMHLHIRILM